MSEARLSAVELGYIKSTLELVVEELEGVEVGSNDYVLTTGAKEQAMDCLNLIELKQKFLEPDMYRPLDFEEDRPPWEDS